MTQVFREHAAVVARVAERAAMGNHAVAEDATQQAFIEAVRLWPGFWEWPSAKQRAWLCERARNRVIDNWRATRRELAAESLPADRAAQSAEEISLSRVALERCLEAIGGMPERARQVAYLKWHEEWTITEIARRLGVDRATVLRDLRAMTLLLIGLTLAVVAAFAVSVAGIMAQGSLTPYEIGLLVPGGTSILLLITSW